MYPANVTNVPAFPIKKFLPVSCGLFMENNGALFEI